MSFFDTYYSDIDKPLQIFVGCVIKNNTYSRFYTGISLCLNIYRLIHWLLMRTTNRSSSERDKYNLSQATTDGTCVFKIFRLALSPTCSCGFKDQTEEFILRNCSYYYYRQSEWPTENVLQTKLFADREKLETALILQTGLQV